MSLNVAKIKNSGGNNRVEQPVLEVGAYPARVVQVLDLGVQNQRPYQGQPKPPKHCISVTYELLDAFMVDENGNELEDKPRWVSEDFPLNSLDSDLAKSTKRYMAIDPEIAFGGDFTLLVGQPCMVTTVNRDVGDKTYTNVAGVNPMRARDAARAPELVNPPKVFVLDNPDMEVFLSLPEFLQERIKSNLNYQGSVLQKMVDGDYVKEKVESVRKEEPEEQEEDSGVVGVEQQEEFDEDAPW